LGPPVAAILTGGDVSDVRRYAPGLAVLGPGPKVLLGDKDYDADSYIGCTLIASTRLWVRRFVNTT
jgi:hypothetical protein